jgi:hypothetical protein
MPDPRSTTPTRNPSAFNSPYNPASVALPSTQRSSDTTATKQSPLPLRSSPSPSARSPKKRGHSSDSELVADADPAKQQHPLKKMRSRDPRSKEAEAQGQVDRSSSSDSSSQERTDTETGINTRDALDPSSASAHPPSAKKRTRTLTTPHQSAVLHALLAQVCFSWLQCAKSSLLIVLCRAVSLSDHCHARRSRPVYRLERSQGSGTWPVTLDFIPLIFCVRNP